MKSVKTKLISLIPITFLLLFPMMTFASGNIFGITYECTGNLPGDCTFQDVLDATKNFLNKITTFAIAFSVVVIAVAGYRYMISGDNPGERKKANDMLKKVVIGIFFMMAAWLIVSLILHALTVNSVIKF